MYHESVNFWWHIFGTMTGIPVLGFILLFPFSEMNLFSLLVSMICYKKIVSFMSELLSDKILISSQFQSRRHETISSSFNPVHLRCDFSTQMQGSRLEATSSSEIKCNHKISTRIWSVSFTFLSGSNGGKLVQRWEMWVLPYLWSKLLVNLHILSAFSSAFSSFSRPTSLSSLYRPSLFHIVKFPNDECLDATNQSGVCYTPLECKAFGGTGSTLCAKGYGTCCSSKLTCLKIENFNFIGNAS